MLHLFGLLLLIGVAFSVAAMLASLFFTFVMLAFAGIVSGFGWLVNTVKTFVYHKKNG